MTVLETYQTRFDEHAWQVFRRVLQRATHNGYVEISEIQLISELLDDQAEVFTEFFRLLAINPSAFRAQVDQQMSVRPLIERESVTLSSTLIEIFKYALSRARVNGRERITTTDLLATLAQISESSLVRLLEGLGFDQNQISSAMLACLRKGETEAAISSSEVNDSETTFRQGEVVRIMSGPFGAFTGRVHQANLSRSTVTISLIALGKQQIVELPFSEVQKVQFS